MENNFLNELLAGALALGGKVDKTFGLLEYQPSPPAGWPIISPPQSDKGKSLNHIYSVADNADFRASALALGGIYDEDEGSWSFSGSPIQSGFMDYSLTRAFTRENKVTQFNFQRDSQRKIPPTAILLGAEYFRCDILRPVIALSRGMRQCSFFPATGGLSTEIEVFGAYGNVKLPFPLETQCSTSWPPKIKEAGEIAKEMMVTIKGFAESVSLDAFPFCCSPELMKAVLEVREGVADKNLATSPHGVVTQSAEEVLAHAVTVNSH